MAPREGSLGPADLDDEKLRGWIGTMLRTMMARRATVQHRHAVLRDLRLEMQQVLVNAPMTHGDFAETVTFRARLAKAVDHEIAAAEADITANFKHLPGVRN